MEAMFWGGASPQRKMRVVVWAGHGNASLFRFHRKRHEKLASAFRHGSSSAAFVQNQDV